MSSNNNPNHPERRRPAHHPPLETHNKPIIIFLTICTDHRRKILANDQMHAVLVEAWNSSIQWMVGRYVIMPDHIHLFCSPVGKAYENVAKWVIYWKRAVSRMRPDLQPIWQRDCWDTQLRRHESYTEKWAYMLNNPVRAGLVDDVDKWLYKGELHQLSF
jgi:putative transposase